MIRYVPLLAALAVILLVAALLFGGYSILEDQCQAKGGHLVTAGRGWLCVSADGRVIE